MDHWKANASNRSGKEEADATHRSHRPQAHLPLSPGVPEPPLSAHFGQQHAEVWREKIRVHIHVCRPTRVCAHSLPWLLKAIYARLWRPTDDQRPWSQRQWREERGREGQAPERLSALRPAPAISSSHFFQTLVPPSFKTNVQKGLLTKPHS